MYVYGAAAALAASFLVVAFFVNSRGATLNEHSRDLSGSAGLAWLRRWRMLGLARALSLGALLLCIASGLFGTRSPYANINMTLFWIVFLLGCTYLTALAGDFYALVNPWRVLGDGLTRAFGNDGRGRMKYPRRLGYWPALLFYMALIWLELFGAVQPHSLALILLAYSGINLFGVWLFGSQDWFRYCEFLGVFLRLVGKMAPLDYVPAQDRPAAARLRLRAPFVGVLEEPVENLGLLVFALFMLSSTAFDGARETVPWLNFFWRDLFGLLKPWVGNNPITAFPLLRTVYLWAQGLILAASPFIYLGVYLAFIALAKSITRSALGLRELALRFGYTLLPIALVYNITHYYTLLITQGVKIIPLASDPFGLGWNLFGTAGWLRAPIIPDAGVVWHTQVALIVFGHIVSVYLAHVEALRTFRTRREATLSQLPMLLLMMVFTTTGLWILAQPIKGGM